MIILIQLIADVHFLNKDGTLSGKSYEYWMSKHLSDLALSMFLDGTWDSIEDLIEKLFSPTGIDFRINKLYNRTSNLIGRVDTVYNKNAKVLIKSLRVGRLNTAKIDYEADNIKATKELKSASIEVYLPYSYNVANYDVDLKSISWKVSSCPNEKLQLIDMIEDEGIQRVRVKKEEVLNKKTKHDEIEVGKISEWDKDESYKGSGKLWLDGKNLSIGSIASKETVTSYSNKSIGYYNNKKGDNNMNKSKFNFKGLENVGAKYEIFAMSFMGGGTAVHLGGDQYFTFDKDTKQLTEVTGFTMELPIPGMVMPSLLKDLKVGDIILVDKKPAFVSEVTSNNYKVIGADGQEKTLSQVKNALMPQMSFVEKIMNPFGEMDFGSNTDSSNPFSNPMMMMAFIGEDSGDSKMGDMMTMMMMSQMMSQMNAQSQPSDK